MGFGFWLVPDFGVQDLFKSVGIANSAGLQEPDQGLGLGVVDLSFWVRVFDFGFLGIRFPNPWSHFWEVLGFVFRVSG